MMGGRQAFQYKRTQPCQARVSGEVCILSMPLLEDFGHILLDWVPPAHRSELLDGHPVALVYDAATRTFWRNVKARSLSNHVPALGTKRPAVLDLPLESGAAPFAANLPAGLTRRCRPCNARITVPKSGQSP
jgi:hypothetical protein